MDQEEVALSVHCLGRELGTWWSSNESEMCKCVNFVCGKSNVVVWVDNWDAECLKSSLHSSKHLKGRNFVKRGNYQKRRILLSSPGL